MEDGEFECPVGHAYAVKEGIPVLRTSSSDKGSSNWKVRFPDVQAYDRIRKEYNLRLPKEQVEADRHLIDRIEEVVNLHRMVLDVATGMGTLLVALSRRTRDGTIFLGTDIDETPLRGAKLKLEERESYDCVSLCVMDGKRLALKSEAFPAVTSYFGFNNIPDAKSALSELARVLEPAGTLAFANLFFEEGSKSQRLAERSGYLDVSTEERLVSSLEGCGFHIDGVEAFYSGEWPHNPMDLLPVEGDWYVHVFVKAHKK